MLEYDQKICTIILSLFIITKCVCGKILNITLHIDLTMFLPFLASHHHPSSRLNMKKHYQILALAFSLVTTVQIEAQTQATSNPVGYITVNVPAGSVGAPSYTTLSIPLNNPAVFSGTIASVDSATQITLNGAAWTTDQFIATPYLARVTSGSNTGRFFRITANTANRLTVGFDATPTITTLVGTLSVGDSVSIVPANTIGSIFGTTSPVLVTGASASVSDNLYILNGPGLGWGTYFHNGTNWKKAGSAANQNNAVIYPDEGLLVVHIGTSAVNLKFSGGVPNTNEKTDISGTGSTFAAMRFPVDTQLSAVGFETTAGWLSGGSAGAADNVWAWSTSLNQWEQFYYTGSNWRKAGSISNQNTRLLTAGSAVIVIRNGTTTTTTLSQALPYTP